MTIVIFLSMLNLHPGSSLSLGGEASKVRV